MNPTQSNAGVNRLARILQSRMGEHQKASSSLPLEFGQVRADGSLITNTFPIAIPQGDYLVCKSTAAEVVAGARVLVAWIGSDAVIIDLIQPAGRTGPEESP